MHLNGSFGVIVNQIIAQSFIEYDWMKNFEYLKNLTIYVEF